MSRFVSKFEIGQFGCSILPPCDAKGKLTIELNAKIFQLGTTI